MRGACAADDRGLEVKYGNLLFIDEGVQRKLLYENAESFLGL